MRVRRRGSAALLTLVLGVAACDGTVVSPAPSASPTQPPPSASPIASATASPSPSPSATESAAPDGSEDLTAVYEQINRQVQEIRGLEERRPVVPQIVSSEELTEILGRTIREETPPELVAAYERLYQAMGLMPEDESLTDVYVELLESQVGGLYDASSESLYVLSKEGDVGAVERVLYAHEYQHALQDQNFDLEAFQPADLVDQTDRQLARQALVEGDAYLGMTYWLQQHLTSLEMVDVLEMGNDPEATEALERIPPIVSSQILFPAINGLTWVLGIQQAGGWEAVDAAFGEPPDSTEQILHPEKWATREPPMEVDLPDDLAARMGDGWKVSLEDTLGEHQMGVWLGAEVSVSPIQPAPPAAAVGWGGDRLALLEGPDEAWAVVIATAWDSEADAREFATAAETLVGDGDHPGTVISDGTDVSVILAVDSETLDSAVEAAGLDRDR